MKYWTRKKGSQRRSSIIDIIFDPNFAGQGGFDYMAFYDGERWYCVQPETIAEVRELQSQAAILALNVKESK